MADDFSHPFAVLAALRVPEKAAKTSGAEKGRVAPDDAQAPVEEGDAVLFLNALGPARPLRGKQSAGRGEELAQSLRKAREDRERKTPARSEQAPSEQSRPEPASVDAADASPEHEHEELFAKAMQGVRPVTAKGRDLARAAAPLASPPAVDPAKALRDLLDGSLEFALRHTDEYMEGFVVGLDPLILGRLRAGRFSPEAHLDLHGQNARQAFEALSWFVKNAWQRGLRTVIVVTGRGNNSPDGVGVLRPLVQQWLTRDPFKRVVLAFCTAQACDGGLGAVYVMLRRYKKSRGKIAWEHVSSDDFLDSL